MSQTVKNKIIGKVIIKMDLDVPENIERYSEEYSPQTGNEIVSMGNYGTHPNIPKSNLDIKPRVNTGPSTRKLLVEPHIF